jgi:haloacetate dehalogenase
MKDTPVNHDEPAIENDESLASPARRSVLRAATTLVAGTAAAAGLRDAALAQPPAGPPPIPGFATERVATSGGVTIHTVKGGSGPPLLLLHGAPLTHYTWREVAPTLAERFTVIATDLRGYGDSSKPQGLPDHSNYSKRALAQDQVDVMKHFGFDRFAVVGQDRGGRVAHRMALDHPDKVTRAVFIDIVPTHYLYRNFSIEFVQAYFHWFSYLRPAPTPENELLAQAAARAGQPRSAAQAEYQRTNGTPEGVHGMCEDYRAGASIDLAHDDADQRKKIRCPLNVLWAENGAMDRLYDVLAIWRERAANVVGKGMPGGHNMQEGAPAELLAELQAFLPT